jgi:hypothetical protein
MSWRLRFEDDSRMSLTPSGRIRVVGAAEGRSWLLTLVAAAIGVALAIVLLQVSPASSTGDRPVAQSSEASSGAADQLTPVTATTLSSSSAPVLGTDERWHVVYELQLTNVRPQPSTVESIDVLDADDESRVVETFSGAGLQNRMPELAPRADSARPRHRRLRRPGLNA